MLASALILDDSRPCGHAAGMQAAFLEHDVGRMKGVVIAHLEEPIR